MILINYFQSTKFYKLSTFLFFQLYTNFLSYVAVFLLFTLSILLWFNLVIIYWVKLITILKALNPIDESTHLKEQKYSHLQSQFMSSTRWLNFASAIILAWPLLMIVIFPFLSSLFFIFPLPRQLRPLSRLRLLRQVRLLLLFLLPFPL